MSEAGTNPYTVSSLIIVETIFCDAETDRGILELYFDRLLRTVSSVQSQYITGATKLIHVIYLSKDKEEYIQRLKQFCDNSDEKAVCTYVVEYEHPPEGYGFNEGDHVDLIKNPNRSSGLRDILFSQAIEMLPRHLLLNQYEFVIRTAIDDDDIWAPWHVEELLRISAAILGRNNHDLFSIGLVNGFVAYANETKTEVQEVKFKRALAGNKFLLSRNFSLIHKLSPWGIPEEFDTYTGEFFLNKLGVAMTLVDNNIASFVYMRRGKNLSLQQKDWCISEILNNAHYVHETDFLDRLKCISPPKRKDNVYDFLPPEKLRITIQDQTNAIGFSTNFTRIKKEGDQIAYYLYKDGVHVRTIWYTEGESSGSFSISDTFGKYRIKAFLRREGEVVETSSSSNLKVGATTKFES